jgi:hypothetical protein
MLLSDSLHPLEVQLASSQDGDFRDFQKAVFRGEIEVGESGLA